MASFLTLCSVSVHFCDSLAVRFVNYAHAAWCISFLFYCSSNARRLCTQHNNSDCFVAAAVAVVIIVVWTICYFFFSYIYISCIYFRCLQFSLCAHRSVACIEKTKSSFNFISSEREREKETLVKKSMWPHSKSCENNGANHFIIFVSRLHIPPPKPLNR